MKMEKWREWQESKSKTTDAARPGRGSRAGRQGGREQQRVEHSHPRSPLCRRCREDGACQSKPRHLLGLTQLLGQVRSRSERALAPQKSIPPSVPPRLSGASPHPSPALIFAPRTRQTAVPTGPPSDVGRGTSTSWAGPAVPTGPPSDVGRGTSTSWAGPPASCPQVSIPWLSRWGAVSDRETGIICMSRVCFSGPGVSYNIRRSPSGPPKLQICRIDSAKHCWCETHTTSPSDPGATRTRSRFSVRTNSVRLSQSPTASGNWVSRFWSTFKIDSFFSFPVKII